MTKKLGLFQPEKPLNPKEKPILKTGEVRKMKEEYDISHKDKSYYSPCPICENKDTDICFDCCYYKK